jgi:hypothetical protein
MSLACASCGESFDAEVVIEACVDELLGIDAHIAIKDGGEPPFGQCPGCQRETVIFEEGICLACESKLQYESCSLCGESLAIDDQELDGLCSYCHYKMSKIRDE